MNANRNSHVPNAGYQEIVFPRTRIATLDVGQIGRKKHYVTALLELDVTDARLAIKRYRSETKRNLSFTAWLVKTISRTIGEFPSAHAWLKGKRKTFVFDDIDISITVERVYEGERVPLPYVIRQTNQKDLTAIHDEIENAKNQAVTRDDIMLGEKQNRFLMDLYYFLPGFLRRSVWRYILSHPQLANRMMGSVVVTSVGMMGKVNGWFIHTSIHPLSFGVGSIIRKPGVVEERIEIREYLHMTVLIDHDVIDGAPMARFIDRLVRNIESGLGLVE